jgi:integrase
MQFLSRYFQNACRIRGRASSICSRNLRPSTQRNYSDSLRLISDRLGHIPLQNLTKAHVDALVTELLASGRRIGNVQRKGLSPRSVNIVLTLLSAVLEDAVRQSTLSRNVAKLVERVSQRKTEMKTWTEAQAAAFLDAVADDRLNAAWQLSLYGLRRGEVLGLRWGDIDLQAKTITIRMARVEVTGVGVVEVEPKTERGKQTLPAGRWPAGRSALPEDPPGQGTIRERRGVQQRL